MDCTGLLQKTTPDDGKGLRMPGWTIGADEPVLAKDVYASPEALVWEAGPSAQFRVRQHV